MPCGDPFTRYPVAMSELPVIALVLAAGRAKRFGRTKQLEAIDGIPLVRRVVDIARQACRDNVVLVAGHDWQSVAAAAGDAARFLVLNDRFEDGLGTSLATAVRATSKAAGALLVLLADQPLITVRHMQDLIDAWRCHSDDIVATRYADTEGPPVIFPPAAFADLAALTGDRGAKAVIRSGRYPVRTIHLEEAAADIDTPDDLNDLLDR